MQAGFVRSIFLLLCLLSWNVKAQEVIATTTFLADIAKAVGGEDVEVGSLLPPGGDPHIYEAVPADAARLAKAKVIIRNGLNLEGWLDKLILSSATPGIQRLEVVASEGIASIQSELHANSYDPHAWMDPIHGIQYAQNIAEGLIRYRPEAENRIRKRLEAYAQSLKALDARIRKLTAEIPADKRIIITSHDAFRYFANRYGYQVYSVLGTTTDADVQLRDMRIVRDVIQKNHVPAIFIESTINPKLLEQMARDLKIRIGGKLYADALAPAGLLQSTYLGMLEGNAKILHEGLAGSRQEESHTSSSTWFLWVMAAFFATAFGYVAWRIRPPAGVAMQHGLIEIRGLNVAYEKRPVLQNFHLTIESGKVYGLLGPNGSGKSTLLKSILGLIPVRSGEVKIGGQAVESIRKHLAYVPQREEIDWDFPATVIDVVMMGRYPHKTVFGKLTEEDLALARQVMEKLDISGLENRQISELSGGQQQRVFIARALCQQAQVYLFDEPFVGVDATTEEKIIGIIRGLAKEGRTVVIVHHDLGKVREYFDRLILINRRLIAHGDVREVFTPELITRAFSGVPDIMADAERM